MGDYWSHWLKIGQQGGDHMPRIYYVNWFRKDEAGRWLWPGYGENSRILKWIFERTEGKADAIETPIGNLPTPNGLDLGGLDVSESDLKELLQIDIDGWLAEIPSIKEHYSKFGDRLPQELKNELTQLEHRLVGAKV